MVFIPYRKITFETHLCQSEAIERFRKAIFTHSPHPFYTSGPMDFLVDIFDDHFTARRLIRFAPGIKHSRQILPVLHGQFIDTPKGTILLVKMYPHFFGVLIVGSLILASLYLLFYDLHEWVITGHLFFDGIALLFIAILSYILLVDSFDPEMKRVVAFLNDIYSNKKCA